VESHRQKCCPYAAYEVASMKSTTLAGQNMADRSSTTSQ
jgi:hypothetical protein